MNSAKYKIQFSSATVLHHVPKFGASIRHNTVHSLSNKSFSCRPGRNSDYCMLFHVQQCPRLWVKSASDYSCNSSSSPIVCKYLRTVPTICSVVVKSVWLNTSVYFFCQVPAQVSVILRYCNKGELFGQRFVSSSRSQVESSSKRDGIPSVRISKLSDFYMYILKTVGRKV